MAVPLLLNPSAGGRAGDRLEHRLRDLPQLQLVRTASSEDLARHTREAVRRGLERVIVAGGDGTLHEAVQHLAGTDCALGIVPLGTGNDLARSLGVPVKIEAALRLALDGTPRSVDLGRVDDRIFACTAGVGMVADVIRHIQQRRGGRRGPWVYPAAVLSCLAGYDSPRVEVTGERDSWSGRAMIVAAANSPRFGGGMQLAPDAVMDDGELDVLIVEKLPWWRVLPLLARVYGGSHLGRPGVHSFRATRLRILPETPLTVVADGEPLMPTGKDGTIIEVLPRALRVVC